MLKNYNVSIYFNSYFTEWCYKSYVKGVIQENNNNIKILFDKNINFKFYSRIDDIYISLKINNKPIIVDNDKFILKDNNETIKLLYYNNKLIYHINGVIVNKKYVNIIKCLKNNNLY